MSRPIPNLNSIRPQRRKLHRNPRRFWIKEAQRIVDFDLIVVTRLASGNRVRKAEKLVESPEHRKLTIKAIKYFRSNGYRVNPRPFSTSDVPAAADFGILKDDYFAFVEVCSRFISEERLKRKMLLNKYAPLYFVVRADNERVLSYLVSKRWKHILVL